MNEEKEVRVNVIWKTIIETGLEHLFILRNEELITANSVILTVVEDKPVRISYNICCNLEWEVNKVDIQIFDGKNKKIVLQSDCSGFMAEFFVDKDGLVIDYPDLVERVFNT